jgi:hypothetical protein
MTVFMKPLDFSYAKSDESSPYPHTTLSAPLSSHVYLRLQSGFFASGSPAYTYVHNSHFFHVYCASHPSRLSLFYESSNIFQRVYIPQKSLKCCKVMAQLINNFVLYLTTLSCRVVNTPASYAEVPGFKSRQGDSLF